MNPFITRTPGPDSWQFKYEIIAISLPAGIAHALATTFFACSPIGFSNAPMAHVSLYHELNTQAKEKRKWDLIRHI